MPVEAVNSTIMSLLDQSKATAQQWLNSPAIDEKTKTKIKELLARTDTRELVDSFYRNLEFGTGGLRGLMGVGPNTMS